MAEPSSKPNKSAKALREERAPLAKRIYDLREKWHAAGKKWAGEDEQEFRKVNVDYDALSAEITVVEAVEKIENDRRDPDPSQPRPGRDDYDGRKAAKKLKKQEKRDRRVAERKAKEDRRLGWLAPSITEEDRCTALQAWCRAGLRRELKWHHEAACRKTGLNPNRETLTLNLRRDYGKVVAEQRALALNINTAGGYTVPEGFVNTLEIALLAYAEVRRWAQVLRTNSGQDLPFPTINDTTNKGQILVENATVTSQDTTFGQIVFHAYKYTSNLVLVPVELVEDSAFDLGATLGNLLGIRIGRIQADHFTFGTGASQPTGYITAGTSFSAASPTAIAADDLYGLRHAVDPAYQGDPSVAWTVHDQILLAIKKLKDGAGRYLWQSSLAGGRPDLIDGIPIFINQSQDSTIASGKKTVAFGAWRKFVIRDVTQFRLRRLVERYADSDQIGFVAFMRGDANLVDAGTHPVKFLQH